MNKVSFLFLTIIVLAAALRVFHLGEIPNGFYSDEAAYGYNAFSILKTARDEYGNFMPMSFKSFGDHKAPLYIYLMVPFIKVFGLNEYAVRLPSALLGIASVFIIFYLAKKIFNNNSVALVSSFLLAVSPFALQFNRMAHENNLILLLIISGILFFLMSFEKKQYLLLSVFAFVASIYTYHDAKVFTPLLLIALLLLYRKKIWIDKRNTVLSILLFIILLIPLATSSADPHVWTRPLYTNILSDKGIVYGINQQVGEDIQSNYQGPKIFNNKLISYTLKLAENYLNEYSPAFLFIYGDPIKIYQTTGNGILYLATLPFIFVGLYILFRKDFHNKWLVVLWLLFSVIPAALTKLTPSASRIISFLPVISVITALGVIFSLSFIKNNLFKKIYLIMITVLFVINISYYLHNYYFNMPVRYAKEWHYGMKQVIRNVVQIQNNYGTVWFGKSAWGYIYPLFYLSYDPSLYQKQAKLSDLNEFGFGWVDRFDKYEFNQFPLDLTTRKDTLFIGDSNDFFKTPKNPLYKLYYPNGDLAFYIADNNSFKYEK